MSEGDTDFEAAGLYGDHVFPPPPDCSRWIPRDMQINGMEYEIFRRPRLFRYAQLRKEIDPNYVDGEGLTEALVGDDLERDKLLYESKLWILDFDVDVQGDTKTLRITFVWPNLLIPFEELQRRTRHCPRGILDFFDEGLYPLAVVFDETDTSKCTLTVRSSEWPSVKEVRYVRFSERPFGMLEVDREEADAAESMALGRLQIIRPGEAVKYDGKRYEFTAPTQWEHLNRLVAAKGEFVDCVKGLKRYFSRPPDAKRFYEAAIEPKGKGSGGDYTYRLKI